MAFTVSKAIVSALTRIGELNIRQATGGSTTTLIDTALPTDFSSDDDFKDGFAVVIRDAGGAGAAPEGEMQRISANVISTGVFTVDTALSFAVASGDMFGFTSPNFDLQTMRRLLNEALISLGDMDFTDISTLETAAAQTEYTMAVAWKRKTPYEIAIEEILTDTDNHQWRVLYGWYPVEAGAGSTGLIIFREQLPIGHNLRIRYRDVHPVVHAYSDVINEKLDPELVIQALIYQIRSWQAERDSGASQSLKDKVTKSKNELNEAKLEKVVEHTPHKPRLLTLGYSDVDNLGSTFYEPPPA